MLTEVRSVLGPTEPGRLPAPRILINSALPVHRLRPLNLQNRGPVVIKPHDPDRIPVLTPRGRRQSPIRPELPRNPVQGGSPGMEPLLEEVAVGRDGSLSLGPSSQPSLKLRNS
jgi:hypothetical protein